MQAFSTNSSPFDSRNESAYQAWRAWKLAEYPTDSEQLRVQLQDPLALNPSEHQALMSVLRKTNVAIYEVPADTRQDKAMVRRLGEQFGLRRLDSNLCADEDGISALQVEQGDGRKRDYIPYTNRRLSWHTDGYYNRLDQNIRGIVMHCVRPAAQGGDNLLLDHEIAYLLLRDENPAWAEALMAPDAVTIPENVENGVMIRPAQTGPVFAVEPETGNLHMRYSARTRNIVWKDTPDTRAAVEFLQALWEKDSPWFYHHRLVQGQGVICNNALHCRTGFHDDRASGQARLLYRARYYDRVAGTDFNEIYAAA